MSINKNGLGSLLIILGLVLFLGNIGIFHFGSFLAAIILGSSGIFFIKHYTNNKKHIWSFLVAFGFFAVVAAILNPAMAGTSLFIIMALGFIMVYRNNQKHWWAIIPAGVLASIASVAAIEERFTIFLGNSEMVFFMGLAATFAYLYFVVSKKWAIYPAASLVAIAILATSFSGSWLLPIVLVASGIYFLKSNRLSFTSSVVVEPEEE